MITKDLGMVTAYAYAVSKGYTGTEEEFAELMASYATVAESAETSAQAAAGSASAAAQSATNASGSASAAAGSASAAASSASTASTKAGDAASSATEAAGSATTASTKADEAAGSASAAAQSATQAAGSASAAAQSATDANTAKTDAQTAKTAAETAQEKAEEAQAAAEAAAQTLVIDDTLTQENQAAEAKTVGDALETKAEVDGYYQDMTVGDAEQLVSSQYVEDKVPYKFRTSGGSADIGNREYVDKIVGGTVAWNQRRNNYRDTITINGVTITNNGTGIIINGTATDDVTANLTASILFPRRKHKILIVLSRPVVDALADSGIFVSGYGTSTRFVNSTIWTRPDDTDWNGYIALFAVNGTTFNNLELKINIFDLTQMFGATIADAVYAMEQATAGAGVAWFRSMFPNDYYEYNPGELISVSGLQSHDTVGFNQWDEEWELGYLDISTGALVESATQIRSKNYIPVLPNTTYYGKMAANALDRNENAFCCMYDANKNFIGYSGGASAYSLRNKTVYMPENCHYIKFYCNVEYGATYKNDICINLAWSGTRNGEYEPYVKRSYPLDSSLILRGIPKLSADNQLYFDGDEYLPEGKVNRKYGAVDLGAIEWISDQNVFFSPSGIPNIKMTNYSIDVTSWIFCPKYSYSSPANVYNKVTDKSVAVQQNTGKLMIYDSAYGGSDIAAFKTSLSGMYLIYELVTPTEETAEAYQQKQICDALGTEEFISETICPVGHVTRYPDDLVKKLDSLPANFSSLIAPTEATTTASKAYTVGSYLILNNTLYKVTAAIASGATITPNTNVRATTIMAEIAALI